MGTIIYPEESYTIMDTAFKVFNQMGCDHKEKYFHHAMAIDFDNKGIQYEREKEVVVRFEGSYVGRYFLDFVVADKIVVELKAMPYPKRSAIRQVLDYLNATKMKLAILIFFTREGVKSKRIINPNVSEKK